ncbi:hypothetical protein OAU75_02030, partial [Flavobacteriaceae bacterium]|nr:hypothetical protein [Flavobacteriaceae bacterium]
AVAQLDLSNRQITDFTGLEEFVNLTDLNLSGNTITSVPFVNLNKLTTLNLSNTGLTELDLSQNSNISSLDLSGNTGLSCVKVSQQIYQQVPSGWIYDSTTSFELECDCPTLSLSSGTPIQEICDGDAMQSLSFEYGGTGTTINVGTMPPGIVSNINSGTLTISGTPVFTNNDYSFSVFTSDGNTNCSQVSQTVTLSKNQSSPSLTLDSGSYNQTIDLGNSMTPIVVTYGGATSSLTITGLPYTQSGNTVTIDKTFTTAGTYSGTITTISSGGCNEITQSIVVTVNAPVVTNAGGGGGTTTGGTTTGGNNSSAQSCSVRTYVPDDNFEAELIVLGYDDVMDDYVCSANISTVTSLSLRAKSINDATGINSFSALNFLEISQNQNLGNTLEISNLTSLVTLQARNSGITSIDVSNNTSLNKLDMDYNPITSLNVSTLNSLETLWCGNTNLTSLDITNNTSLIDFRCQNNSGTGYNLSTINLNNNTNITWLQLNYQNLSSIDVSNITNLNAFQVNNNSNLSCIKASQNQINSLQNWNGSSGWRRDSGVTISTTCN